MAQTTVNQYFVARKSNLTFQPSKKRKVDGSEIEANISSTKTKVPKRASITRSRSKRKNISPPILEDTQSLFPKNDFAEAKPVLSSASPKKTMIAIDSIISKSPMGKLKVDEAINDQAKTILHSRGNAILQTSLKGKGTRSPAKASEILLAMSPKKLTPSKESILTIVKKSETIDKDLQSRKDQLRKKYANLLKDEATKEVKDVKTTPEGKQSGAAGEKVDRKNHLRNKYKHLLNKDASSTSTTTKPIETVSEKPL